MKLNSSYVKPYYGSSIKVYTVKDSIFKKDTQYYICDVTIKSMDGRVINNGIRHKSLEYLSKECLEYITPVNKPLTMIELRELQKAFHPSGISIGDVKIGQQVYYKNQVVTISNVRDELHGSFVDFILNGDEKLVNISWITLEPMEMENTYYQCDYCLDDESIDCDCKIG